MLSRIIFFSFAVSATAFQPLHRPSFAPPMSSTARNILLNEEQTAQILASADDCAVGECSIDQVDQLISDLKEQEKLLSARMDKVMNSVAHLQQLNDKKERKKGEVKAFVKDMLRVFDTSQPIVFPTGFSGDIGDGPKTAYDVLAPKKWKATP